MSTAPHGNVRGRWLFGARSAARTPASRGGFTTIELVAVLAVTLIMVAVAVSAYRTYSARRDVNTSLTAVAPIQVLVTAAYNRTGAPPASELDIPGLLSVTPSTGLIDAVGISHGRIEIRFGSDASPSLRHRALLLTPFETTDGQVVWRCGGGPAEVGLYPLGFSGGTNRTTEFITGIDTRYLSERCR